ncbi:uncharacterized protein LOC121383009 [Gigantopelta aegis]|uniref:uncharacterized protein LOC121383009 n=1 Tax=Gigantopelta aegis TaxID=1735272 RepID=UPI001B887BC8|nr:uncharacterized protein LOC121383009 [Gigantopelta aegis]
MHLRTISLVTHTLLSVQTLLHLLQKAEKQSIDVSFENAEVYNRPFTVEVYNRPFTLEVYNRPFTLEVYNRPFTLEVYNRPFTFEVYNRPFMLEVYNRPFTLEVYNRPFTFEVYNRPFTLEEFQDALRIAHDTSVRHDKLYVSASSSSATVSSLDEVKFVLEMEGDSTTSSTTSTLSSDSRSNRLSRTLQSLSAMEYISSSVHFLISKLTNDTLLTGLLSASQGLG